MFWERFYQLCLENNKKPNPVAKELQIASSTVSQWKNGAIPNGETLVKIANYFEVSIDFLLGISDLKRIPSGKDKKTYDSDDLKIIDAFQSLTEDQKDIVLKALGLE